jgi:hypothetical protein
LRRRAVLLAAALVVLTAAWALHRFASGAREPAEAPAVSVTRGLVSLDEGGRANLDLATETVEQTSAAERLPAYGRVLDPVPLADAVLAREAALASLEPARREADRVRLLSRAAQNASQRELEAAEAALRKARLDAAAAEARLVAGFGAEVAARPDLEGWIGELVSGRVALARLDLPAGIQPSGPPSGVTVERATGAQHLLVAHLIGPAPTTDPLVQGLGWLVGIERDPPSPGTALVGQLEVAAGTETGPRVPASALVRLDGRTWVYVERGSNTFERRAVSLERALPGGWLVAGALAPGEPVVVRGAQELLSAERGAE